MLLRKGVIEMFDIINELFTLFGLLFLALLVLMFGVGIIDSVSRGEISDFLAYPTIFFFGLYLLNRLNKFFGID